MNSVVVEDWLIAVDVIVIVRDCVVVPTEFPACTVKLAVVVADGLPLMIPKSVSNVNPVGREPEIALQVIGVVPVADSVWE